MNNQALEREPCSRHQWSAVYFQSAQILSANITQKVNNEKFDLN